jgi:two-component system sensor kinase FixL
MFGYGADTVLGQNVNMLMADPYRAEHDGYLDRYRRTGERRIIGSGRRVEGRRQDDSEFPVDLAVSEVIVDGRRLFAGVLRDLSGRV